MTDKLDFTTKKSHRSTKNSSDRKTDKPDGNSVSDAVLKAVNLGGDTDTIAALTGGLAGLYYGYDTIPKKWLKKIVSPDLINNLLNKLNPDAKYIQKL